MANITVRNIPDEIFEKIKVISALEKRSINSEILAVLEKGLSETIKVFKSSNPFITNETQMIIWEQLSGKWEDDRTTGEIINDIYSHRSEGREIDL